MVGNRTLWEDGCLKNGLEKVGLVITWEDGISLTTGMGLVLQVMGGSRTPPVVGGIIASGMAGQLVMVLTTMRMIGVMKMTITLTKDLVGQRRVAAPKNLVRVVGRVQVVVRVVGRVQVVVSLVAQVQVVVSLVGRVQIAGHVLIVAQVLAHVPVADPDIGEA
jgi:hypothetical protein